MQAREGRLLLDKGGVGFAVDVALSFWGGCCCWGSGEDRAAGIGGREDSRDMVLGRSRGGRV